MELTGAAESGATGRTLTRRGSVRVERWVRPGRPLKELSGSAVTRIGTDLSRCKN